jgi:hypothetical protein
MIPFEIFNVEEKVLRILKIEKLYKRWMVLKINKNML